MFPVLARPRSKSLLYMLVRSELQLACVILLHERNRPALRIARTMDNTCCLLISPQVRIVSKSHTALNPSCRISSIYARSVADSVRFCTNWISNQSTNMLVYSHEPSQYAYARMRRTVTNRLITLRHQDDVNAGPYIDHACIMLAAWEAWVFLAENFELAQLQ